MTTPSRGSSVVVQSGDAALAGIITDASPKRLQVAHADGRSVTYSPKKVIVPGSASLGDPDDEGARARYFEALEACRSAIDLEELWTAVAGELDELPLDEAAELVGLEPPDIGTDALALAILDDRLYFKLKGATVVPYGEEAVSQEKARRERAEAKARELGDGLGVFQRNLPGATLPALLDVATRRLVDALVDVAHKGKESPRLSLAGDVLKGLGRVSTTGPNDPMLLAFQLLADLGIWGEDEDVELAVNRITADFPPEIDDEIARVEAALPGLLGGDRVDMRAMLTLAIDDASTKDIDDAFAIEASGDGGVIVHVLIADPGSIITVGTPLYEEGRTRTSTLYHPTGPIPMLPPRLSEELFSLREGEERPVMDFMVTLEADGTPRGVDIREAVAVVDRHLTYDEVDEVLAGTGSLPDDVTALLHEAKGIADGFKARRIDNGAMIMRRLEVSPRVGADGTVSFRRHDPGSASRGLVQELMILAGSTAAKFCKDAGIPTVYRTQELPLEVTEGGGRELDDPVAIHALLKKFKRAELSIHPGRHQSLGLDQYTQVTSPLRRFQDLVMHLQIKGMLASRAAPLGDKDLFALFKELEEKASLFVRIQRGADRYWLYKHFQSVRGSTVEGIVVETRDRRAIVLLEEYDHKVPVGVGGAVDVGERLTLRITAAKPRQERLILEPA